MKYTSVFEIIGPIMIGPSSSHTAGVVRIGKMARELFGQHIDSACIHLYGSFAKTYRGHASDVAVVAGLLGFEMDDGRIKNALEHAKEQSMAVEFITTDDVCDHPNTIVIHLKNAQKTLDVTGVSVGGGAIAITKINRFSLSLSGENPTLLVSHKDVPGMIAKVSNVLNDNNINIAHMEVSRSDKGAEALMIIESDTTVPCELVEKINGIENIHWAKQIRI